MSLGVFSSMARGESNASSGGSGGPSVIPLSVYLSGGGTFEKGFSVNSVNLTWSYNNGNADPDNYQSLNQGIGNVDASLRSYLYNTPLTNDATFTITANDSLKGTAVSSTTVRFNFKRFWGISASRTLDNSTIINSNNDLTSSISKDITYDCSGGRYFWYAYLNSYGPISNVNTTINNLPWADYYNGIDELEGNTTGYTITVINNYGISETYRMLMSYNIQYGSSITVKYRN